MTKLASCQLLAVTKNGVDVVNVVAAEKTDIQLPDVLQFEIIKSWNEIEGTVFSKERNLLGMYKNNEVLVVDPNSFSEVQRFLIEKACRKLSFSPKGTYLVSQQISDTPGTPNSTVHHIKEGTVVFRGRNLITKNLLQWNHDESLCFHQVSEKVRVAHDGFPVANNQTRQIERKHLCSFSASQSSKQPNKIAYNVAIFVAPKSSLPGCVAIYSVNRETDQNPILLNSKSFFKAEEVDIRWNPGGSALLAIISVEPDATSKSYYENSCMYFIEAKKDGIAFPIISYEQGPVSDAKWSPTGKEFIALCGSGSTQITIYDGKTGNPKLSLGNSRRNNALYSPFEKFIFVGGFGNLSGDFDIWDRTQGVVIGSGNAQCTVLTEWCPNGRWILCATVAPRMRVDNGIRIYDYYGELIGKLDISEMYSACWFPAMKDEYVDKPISPRKEPASRESGTKKQELYAPPNASESFIAKLHATRKAREAQRVAIPLSREYLIPVLEPQTKVASKSAKRNAAKKKRMKMKKEAEKAASIPDQADTDTPDVKKTDDFRG